MPDSKEQFINSLVADLVVETVRDIPSDTYEYTIGQLHYYATYCNRAALICYGVTLLKSVYVTSEKRLYEPSDNHVQVIYNENEVDNCDTFDADERCDVLLTDEDYRNWGRMKIIYPPIRL